MSYYRQALYAVAEEHDGPLVSLDKDWATFQNQRALPTRVHPTDKEKDPIYSFQVTEAESEPLRDSKGEFDGKFAPVGLWIVYAPDLADQEGTHYIADSEDYFEAEYFAWDAMMVNGYIDDAGNVSEQ